MVHINYNANTTLKQLKAPKENDFIDNKSYNYVKPTNSPLPRFYGLLKI